MEGGICSLSFGGSSIYLLLPRVSPPKESKELSEALNEGRCNANAVSMYVLNLLVIIACCPCTCTRSSHPFMATSASPTSLKSQPHVQPNVAEYARFL